VEPRPHWKALAIYPSHVKRTVLATRGTCLRRPGKGAPPMALSPKALQLIEGKNFAHFTTLMKDGWPHTTPVWVDHEDGRYILVNTAVGRVKERNVRRDPRVSLSIHDQADPYRRISIKGRVVSTVGGETAWEHIDKLSLKYTGAGFPRNPAQK
jgi:PPOX class probable F420-dependent enzyme